MKYSHSTTAYLKFSTEIVKRLGEELNPTLSKVILELAKNSYDADATKCRVELRNISRPGGTIVVEDNGDGMTSSQINEGWLVLGTSSKDPTLTTRLGRIPAGSKGLGRLAALRMGRTAKLSTISRRELDRQHELWVDWDKFDRVRTVDDYKLEITTRSESEHYLPGTTVKISELRNAISRSEVQSLARELVLLSDPFGGDPQGFNPELHAPEFKELESLVRERYFDDAELHLSAEVNAGGEASARVLDWKGKLLYEANHSKIASGKHKTYRCPSAKLDFWVFILNKETFELRKSSMTEVRRWLRDFGGVHIYCDGIRVNPYGDPGDDWLGLNLQRVRSPEERPGTNTSIGRIVIQDLNDQLTQKTDRSGFIEGAAFRDLRSFARDSLNWMAKCRLADAELRRKSARLAAPKDSLKAKRKFYSQLESHPKELRDIIRKSFADYASERDREINVLKKEVQLYRTLSTAGIIAATFAHESGANPIKIIWQSITAIERRTRKHFGKLYVDSFKKPVEGIKRALNSLAVLGSVTLGLLDHEKRRNARLELHDILHDVLDSFDPFLRGRDIRVVKSLDKGAPFLRGQQAALESILTNLINNSVVAFEESESPDRKIEITTEITNGSWRLSVSDNGPGIVGIQKSDIWLPGQTTRKNGTGLGLTIVRDAVTDLGGSVEAIAKGPLGGAVITIRVPILGS